MLVSSFSFAVMGVAIKHIARELPNEMIVFFRSAIGLIALLPYLFRNGVPRLKTAHLHFHVTRGLVGLTAMYCFFYAIAHLPLAEAMLLNYSTPLFIPFIALLWLHEPTSPKAGRAIALGFIGVALILKPGVEMFRPAALVGVCSGLFAAFAMVNIRRLTRTEPTTRIVFYFSAIATIVSAVPLLWTWQTPSSGLWLPLIVMGIFATIAQLALTRAYALAPAAQVGPFIYATVVFAGLSGAVLWGERLDAFSIAGIGLVCIGSIGAMRHTPVPTTVSPEAVPLR